MATGMVAAPPCAVCGLASACIELVLTTRSAGARTTLERIWQATGRPERVAPYEQMDWPMQEAMQHAAASKFLTYRREKQMEGDARGVAYTDMQLGCIADALAARGAS